MKQRRVVPAMMISLVLYISCSPKLAPVGHYQETPVTADGNTDEWSLPLRFSNPQYTFQYSVTNDKKNIYICILSKDDATQLKMLRYGINIYFDSKGDKNKNIKLEFPVRKPEQIQNNYNNNGEPIRNSGTKLSKDQLLLQSDYYNTKGFANIENGQFSVGDPKNRIQVALKLHDDSTLVYEAIIPFSNIPNVNLYARGTGKNFDVGIAVNAAQNRYSNNNNYPRPSYGMRGMHMGMGGGGYRGGSQQQNQQPKEEVNWYEFRLAFNNKQ
jgi:hypothetical protein